MNYELIAKLSKQEPKTLLQRMVKLQEEVGELAQEVLIHENASGSQHKSHGPDGVLGECIDIALVVLSIYFQQGGSPQHLESTVNRKCAKWEQYQAPQKSDF